MRVNEGELDEIPSSLMPSPLTLTHDLANISIGIPPPSLSPKEDEGGLDDLFLEEDTIVATPSFQPKSTKQANPIPASSALPTPIPLSTLPPTIKAPKRGSVVHSGQDVVIHFAYRFQNQQGRGQTSVGLYTEYDLRSLEKGYRAYIPSTQERFSVYWYLASNLCLPPLSLPVPQSTLTSDDNWSLAVVMETRDEMLGGWRHGGDVRVLPLAAVCKTCVSTSTEMPEQGDTLMEEVARTLSSWKYAKSVENDAEGRRGVKRGGMNASENVGPRLMTASSLKKAKVIEFESPL